MSKLEGKVAIVTGGSKGIGAAIARSLAAEGASVVVNYASSKAGADTVVGRDHRRRGPRLSLSRETSRRPREAQGIVDAAIRNYGRLDILVNNSGVYEFKPLGDITEEHFHRHFNINVLGLLLTTQAAARQMSEGGSVINIGSVITRPHAPGSAVYTATKGAVRHDLLGTCQGARSEKDSRQLPQPRAGRNRGHARPGHPQLGL